MRVEENQKSLIANRLAFGVDHIERVAAQQHAETADKGRRPFFVAHFIPTGVEPHDILDFRAADTAALEKFGPAKNRMLMSQLDQFSGEFEKFVLLFRSFPIEPAHLIVLTIGIIVSILAAPK